MRRWTSVPFLLCFRHSCSVTIPHRYRRQMAIVSMLSVVAAMDSLPTFRPILHHRHRSYHHCRRPCSIGRLPLSVLPLPL
uniref:Putative secreted protein n=1 Tax=Anopheles marajoara TaxID=58244 RepID=A0A2M4CC16_9DIPT